MSTKTIIKRFIRHLFIFLILSIQWIFAQSLDITEIKRARIREELRPMLSSMVTELEEPLIMSLNSEDPIISLGAKLLPLYSEYSLKSQMGFSSFWGSAAISSNLNIAGHIAVSQWGGDNIFSFGPTFSTSRNKENEFFLFCFAINHLKGPDDFHFRDICLTTGKYYKKEQWDFALAASAHFITCKVHIEDRAVEEENYKAKKNIDIYHGRAGIYRNFEKFNCGLEFDISKEIVSGSFVIIGDIE